MEISNHYMQDLTVTIRLDEGEFFDITYSRSGKPTPMQVRRVGARVDLIDGMVRVNGVGFLRNRDGSVGQRERGQWLKPDQISDRMRDVIAGMASQYRAGVGDCRTYKFE